MRLPFLPRLASLLATAALVGGCASSLPAAVALDATSVTVVGLTRLDGVGGINRNVAARDLVRRIEDGGRRRVAGPERARDALGAASHAALLDRYAARGRLDERDVRLLVRAPLDTRFALLVRVERDDVRELEPRTEPVRDAGGRPLGDRYRIERATRRDMALGVVLVDRAEGRRHWTERGGRSFRASPVTRVDGIRYAGDSFTGSVAALLANRLVSGGGVPAAPPPASRRETLAVLFDEIGRELP